MILNNGPKPPPPKPPPPKEAPKPPPAVIEAKKPSVEAKPTTTTTAPSPTIKAPSPSTPQQSQVGEVRQERAKTFQETGERPRFATPSTSGGMLQRQLGDQLARQTAAPPALDGTQGVQSSSLQSEVIGDGRVNCLERAFEVAGPNDSVTLLNDRRDSVGHAVVERQDGTVIDPNQPNQTYESLDNYLQQNTDYEPVPSEAARQIPRADLEQVFATPANSPARSEALQATGLSAVSAVNVADPATNAQITNNVIGELQQLAAGGADAAQLTTAAYDMAVEEVRTNYPNMPAAERMDTAVAIATYALNGPGNIGSLRAIDSGETAVIATMEGIRDSGAVAWSAGPQDSTVGGGTLYPGFDDDTPNQAFHTNFFVAAGYVAGQDPGGQVLAQLGNIFHETVDATKGGGSMADFSASSMGLIIGGQMNAARDVAAQADAGELTHGGNLDLLLPSIVHGGMTPSGVNPPRVDGMSDAQYDASLQMADSVRSIRDGVDFQVFIEHNPVYALGVGVFGLPHAIDGILGGNP